MFFFFSSRRRHTRWPRDWSSDVCSSDLAGHRPERLRPGAGEKAADAGATRPDPAAGGADPAAIVCGDLGAGQDRRSEERRVGKECRARWAGEGDKKKESRILHDGREVDE